MFRDKDGGNQHTWRPFRQYRYGIESTEGGEATEVVRVGEGVAAGPSSPSSGLPSGLVCAAMATDSGVRGSRDPFGQPPEGALSPTLKPPTEGSGELVVILFGGGPNVFERHS